MWMWMWVWVQTVILSTVTCYNIMKAAIHILVIVDEAHLRYVHFPFTNQPASSSQGPNTEQVILRALTTRYISSIQSGAYLHKNYSNDACHNNISLGETV